MLKECGSKQKKAFTQAEVRQLFRSNYDPDIQSTELECVSKRNNLRHLRKIQTTGFTGVLCEIAHFLYEHVAA